MHSFLFVYLASSDVGRIWRYTGRIRCFCRERPLGVRLSPHWRSLRLLHQLHKIGRSLHHLFFRPQKWILRFFYTEVNGDLLDRIGSFARAQTRRLETDGNVSFASVHARKLNACSVDSAVLFCSDPIHSYAAFSVQFPFFFCTDEWAELA